MSGLFSRTSGGAGINFQLLWALKAQTPGDAEALFGVTGPTREDASGVPGMLGVMFMIPCV